MPLRMERHGWVRVATLAVATGAIAACSSLASSTGREGNLGNGVFQYQCDTDQDPVCPAGHKTLPGCDVTTGATLPAGTQCFPSVVAVGGRFHIVYRPNYDKSNVGNPIVKVVAPEFMTSLGDGQLHANKPGTVGVYTQSTVDSSLLDYTLIKIGAIHKLQILDSTKRSVPLAVNLTKGQATPYSLVAQDQNGTAMGGAIETFSWESSDATVATFTTDARSASVQVSAVAPGTATITAYADDSKTIKASFAVTVK